MRKKGELPVVSPEAKSRIKEFVASIGKLQASLGVELTVQDDTFAFRDTRRTDEWDGYGEWDAQIFNASERGRLKARNISFEGFELWGK